MARQRLAKDLPPIQEAFASFAGFQSGFSRQSILTNVLKKCAAELQRDEALPFYAMREVAAFFDVPLRTAALAYEALDMEGILHRIRGSQTMLAGRKNSARKPVNAVVGLPISLQAMISSPFECNLQMELEERLRVRGYVADSIFFRSNEEFETTFTDRLLRHNLDMVIWQSPHPLSTHVLMSLRERGVRLFLLQPTESPLRIPSRCFHLQWKEGYVQMAAHWQKQGIRTAVVPEPENLLCRRALKQLRPVLDAHQIELLVVDATESALRRCFLDQKRQGSVLAFMDFHTADSLCNGYPDLIKSIVESNRLAFCRGPVRIPRLTTERICVDLVEIDPATLAEGVVNDLCDPSQKKEGLRGTFAAQFHSQVIMSDMSDPVPH